MPAPLNLSPTFAYVYNGTYDPINKTFTIAPNAEGNVGTLNVNFSDNGSETSAGAGDAGNSDNIATVGESIEYYENGTDTGFPMWYYGRSGNDLIASEDYIPGNTYPYPDHLYSMNGGYTQGQVFNVSETEYYFCFARGTLITTPEGQIPVEQLQIGSLVQNQQGQAVAVKWMGRQTKNAVIAKMTNGLPICIQQGALGHGLPLRDLYVSPDHAMLVDGLLVHASALVNGRTITQAQSWQGPVEYFHIETEAHEIVLAEGAPAETFIDNVSRQTFDNYAEYAALYPHAAPMQELALPRVKFARQLPRAVAQRLQAVADALHGEAALA